MLALALAGARSWADVLDVDKPASLGSAIPPMPGAPDGPHAGGYPVDVAEFSRGDDGPARSRAVRDYPELAADAERLWLVIAPGGGAIDHPAVPDRGSVLRSEPDRPVVLRSLRRRTPAPQPDGPTPQLPLC